MVKFNRDKNFIMILCISLFMILLLTVTASGESVRIYDGRVVTGFEPVDYNKTVDLPYKYSLISLRKEFPGQLVLWMGGEVSYQENAAGTPGILSVSNHQNLPITVVWNCLEDYDSERDVFHFVPDLKGYELADGLVLPVITVNVLGKLPEPPSGHIPDEPEYFFLKEGETQIQKTGLPASYNAYEENKLPPVRNQGNTEICWAFSTIACVEADLIHDGNADTKIDLSERHLAYFTYHDFYDEKNCNTGDHIDPSEVQYLQIWGNFAKASSTLTNKLGPVAETVVPFIEDSSAALDPALGRTGTVQVTDTYVLDLKNDRDSVKRAILEHGAVSAAYYRDDSYYSAVNNSYYNSVSGRGTNHLIAIVGWNDAFPKGNFKSDTDQPEGNGAWLIRNSWGNQDYNYSGYFWMSFYDQSLYKYAYAIDAQPWQYDHVYAYDNTPFFSYLPEQSSDTTISQKFTVDQGEEIKAIDFYSHHAIESISFTVTAGDNSVTESAADLTPGYHLIPLTTPILIQDRTDVFVSYYDVVPGSSFAPSIEYRVPGEPYFLENGIKFYAEPGSGIMINGQIDSTYPFDAKIKLFTDDLTPDLILPSDLTLIGSQAFAGGAFRYVKLPEGAVSIGADAFADCRNLVIIYIPSETTQIDDQAFGNITDLIIEGVSGSVAETYANNHGFTFKPVS